MNMQNKTQNQTIEIQVNKTKGMIVSMCIGETGKDVRYYMQLPDGRALLCRRYIDSVENPMEVAETCNFTYMTPEEFRQEFKGYDIRGADVYYAIISAFGVVAYFYDWFRAINSSRMIIAPWRGEPIITINVWSAEKYAKEMYGPEVAKAVKAVREVVRPLLYITPYDPIIR